MMSAPRFPLSLHPRVLLALLAVGLAPAPPSIAQTVAVPAGAFVMGDAGTAAPEHAVTLTKPFALDLDEVTNALYRDGLEWAHAQGLISVDVPSGVVTDVSSGEPLIALGAGSGENRCWIGFAEATFTVEPGRESWPVVFVTWYGAASYCDWRSVREGRQAAYDHASWQCGPGGNPYDASGYRLPTEAEWEFAAQYDDERRWPWGSQKPDPSLANFWPSSAGHPHTVGTLTAGQNALGVRDLAGNVWEWTNDWFALYSEGALTDPPGPASGAFRVVRGGAWLQAERYMLCASRGDLAPGGRNEGLGFRCARTATETPVRPTTWGRIKSGMRGRK